MIWSIRSNKWSILYIIQWKYKDERQQYLGHVSACHIYTNYFYWCVEISTKIQIEIQSNKPVVFLCKSVIRAILKNWKLWGKISLRRETFDERSCQRGWKTFTSLWKILDSLYVVYLALKCYRKHKSPTHVDIEIEVSAMTLTAFFEHEKGVRN